MVGRRGGGTQTILFHMVAMNLRREEKKKVAGTVRLIEFIPLVAQCYVPDRKGVNAKMVPLIFFCTAYRKYHILQQGCTTFSFHRPYMR